MAEDGLVSCPAGEWTDLLDGNGATTASYMFQNLGPGPVLVRESVADPGVGVIDGALYSTEGGEGFPTQTTLTIAGLWARPRSTQGACVVKVLSTDV